MTQLIKSENRRITERMNQLKNEMQDALKRGDIHDAKVRANQLRGIAFVKEVIR